VKVPPPVSDEQDLFQFLEDAESVKTPPALNPRDELYQQLSQATDSGAMDQALALIAQLKDGAPSDEFNDLWMLERELKRAASSPHGGAPIGNNNDESRHKDDEHGFKKIQAGQPLELPGQEVPAAAKPSASEMPPSESKVTLCEDCGKQISKRAASCPHCGAPVGVGGNEYSSGNDGSWQFKDLPDDYYKAPPIRKKTQQKNEEFEDTNTSSRNTNTKRSKSSSLGTLEPRKTRWHVLGYLILGYLMCAGLFGIMDNTGVFDSSESKLAQQEADAARDKYESEYAYNARRSHKLTQTHGGLVGAVEDLNNEVRIRNRLNEFESKRQERDAYDQTRREHRQTMLMRSIAVFVLAALGLALLIRRSRLVRRSAPEN
jgi:hypothetical protein